MTPFGYSSKYLDVCDGREPVKPANFKVANSHVTIHFRYIGQYHLGISYLSMFELVGEQAGSNSAIALGQFLVPCDISDLISDSPVVSLPQYPGDNIVLAFIYHEDSPIFGYFLFKSSFRQRSAVNMCGSYMCQPFTTRDQILGNVDISDICIDSNGNHPSTNWTYQCDGGPNYILSDRPVTPHYGNHNLGKTILNSMYGTAPGQATTGQYVVFPDIKDINGIRQVYIEEGAAVYYSHKQMMVSHITDSIILVETVILPEKPSTAGQYDATAQELINTALDRISSLTQADSKPSGLQGIFGNIGCFVDGLLGGGCSSGSNQQSAQDFQHAIDSVSDAINTVEGQVSAIIKGDDTLAQTEKTNAQGISYLSRRIEDLSQQQTEQLNNLANATAQEVKQAVQFTADLSAFVMWLQNYYSATAAIDKMVQLCLQMGSPKATAASVLNIARGSLSTDEKQMDLTNCHLKAGTFRVINYSVVFTFQLICPQPDNIYTVFVPSPVRFSPKPGISYTSTDYVASKALFFTDMSLHPCSNPIQAGGRQMVLNPSAFSDHLAAGQCILARALMAPFSALTACFSDESQYVCHSHQIDLVNPDFISDVPQFPYNQLTQSSVEVIPHAPYYPYAPMGSSAILLTVPSKVYTPNMYDGTFPAGVVLSLSSSSQTTIIPILPIYVGSMNSEVLAPVAAAGVNMVINTTFQAIVTTSQIGQIEAARIDMYIANATREQVTAALNQSMTFREAQEEVMANFSTEVNMAVSSAERDFIMALNKSGQVYKDATSAEQWAQKAVEDASEGITWWSYLLWAVGAAGFVEGTFALVLICRKGGHASTMSVPTMPTGYVSYLPQYDNGSLDLPVSAFQNSSLPDEAQRVVNLLTGDPLVAVVMSVYSFTLICCLFRVVRLACSANRRFLLTYIYNFLLLLTICCVIFLATTDNKAVSSIRFVADSTMVPLFLVFTTGSLHLASAVLAGQYIVPKAQVAALLTDDDLPTSFQMGVGVVGAVLCFLCFIASLILLLKRSTCSSKRYSLPDFVSNMTLVFAPFVGLIYFSSWSGMMALLFDGHISTVIVTTAIYYLWGGFVVLMFFLLTLCPVRSSGEFVWPTIPPTTATAIPQTVTASPDCHNTLYPEWAQHFLLACTLLFFILGTIYIVVRVFMAHGRIPSEWKSTYMIRIKGALRFWRDMKPVGIRINVMENHIAMDGIQHPILEHTYHIGWTTSASAIMKVVIPSKGGKGVRCIAQMSSAKDKFCSIPMCHFIPQNYVYSNHDSTLLVANPKDWFKTDQSIEKSTAEVKVSSALSDPTSRRTIKQSFMAETIKMEADNNTSDPASVKSVAIDMNGVNRPVPVSHIHDGDNRIHLSLGAYNKIKDELIKQGLTVLTREQFNNPVFQKAAWDLLTQIGYSQSVA